MEDLLVSQCAAGEQYLVLYNDCVLVDPLFLLITPAAGELVLADGTGLPSMIGRNNNSSLLELGNDLGNLSLGLGGLVEECWLCRVRRGWARHLPF